jgi:hypothetical protein
MKRTDNTMATRKIYQNIKQQYVCEKVIHLFLVTIVYLSWVPDEGYSRNVSFALSVFTKTNASVLNVIVLEDVESTFDKILHGKLQINQHELH